MKTHKDHKSSEQTLKELDNVLSRLNAMEVVADSDFQKDTIKIMRMLVDGQMHSIKEFDHLKKAMDVMLQQIFKIQNQSNMAQSQ